MAGSKRISRRYALKGLATTLALPLLDAMAPSALLGADRNTATPPRRILVVYIPNGVWMKDWTPAATGAGYEMSPPLAPLAPFKDDMLVLSGLGHAMQGYRAGGCQHGPAQSCFLTCAIPAKETVHAGISVDQVAAQSCGRQTKFPSLELGTEIAVETHCNGFPCAYFQGFSWRGPMSPSLLEINPQLVFERIFGNGRGSEASAVGALRYEQRNSILDLAAEDALRLRAKLGTSDQHKLDEYFNSIREVELRIARLGQDEKHTQTPRGASEPTNDKDEPRRALRDRIASYQGSIQRHRLERRGGDMSVSYADLESYVKIMADLLVLAFQTDVTRIATFMFGREGSQRTYPALEIRGTHHALSHHENRQEKIAQIRKIDRYHVTLFAYLLKKMKAVQEQGGTLLDHSMVLYGGGISDGNQHRYENLPILLAGKGGGTIRSGRHVVYPYRVDNAELYKADFRTRNVPLANLYLAMLHRLGVEAKSFGDSTGELDLS